MSLFESMYKSGVLAVLAPFAFTGILLGAVAIAWKAVKRNIRLLNAGDDMLDALVNGRHRADDEREEVNTAAVKAWLEARKS